MRLFILIALAFAITGCSHKKLVVKNCEQAANSGIYVCDPL